MLGGEQDLAVQNYLQLVARYERLLEISRELTSKLDLNGLLTHIIRAATDLTDTAEASILLIDPQTEELHFVAATNISKGVMDAIVVPREGSIAGWVVTHNEFILVDDAKNDPRWFHDVDSTIEFETRNLLCVPMRAHTQVIGALQALNKHNDAPFAEEDVNTLTTLAAQAAIAIENARLFQQSDLISEMVHELRTPLAAIKASTALLLRPSFPEERRYEILITMQRETDRLSKMTTEFLDLARLESGRARMDIEPFNIRSVLQDSATVVEHQAAERHITLHIDSEDYTLKGDRTKIEQVLLNLLTNAIKYNKDSGQIFLETKIIEDREDRFIQVAVRDTGRGMSAETKANMFQKFFRAADAEGYSQGTGLGLVIAKRIVEAHGGNMWLESELDVGTAFFFTLLYQQEDKGPVIGEHAIAAVENPASPQAPSDEDTQANDPVVPPEAEDAEADVKATNSAENSSEETDQSTATV